MKDSSILIIERFCWAIAASAGILAAWFELRDRCQTEDDRQRTRTYYKKKWQTIQQTGMLQLPEKVIVGFLTTKTTFVAKVRDLLDSLPDRLVIPLIITVPVVGLVGGWFAFGRILAFVLVALLALLPGLYVLILLYLDQAPGGSISPKKNSIDSVVIIVFCLGWLATGLAILKLVLGLNIVLATLAMIMLLPVYALSVSLSLVGLADSSGQSEESKSNWFVFGMTVAASFSITLIALLVGYVADSTCWVPKTMRMLGSNVIFDGLTMLATIMILTWAVTSKQKFALPFAIFLDVVIAAFFALASLYCGVAFTDKHLSIIETARVLVALSPDGGHFEIGPYFWAMHTTFIPTLLYMILIAFCWIGKLLVLPVASVLSRGAVVEKPHHLTAGAFLFIAVVFGVIGNGINRTIDKAPGHQEKKTVPLQSPDNQQMPTNPGE